MPEIAKVYVFQNGMVMVFDAMGQQMPEYHGRWDEQRDRILAARTPTTRFEHDVAWAPVPGWESEEYEDD